MSDTVDCPSCGGEIERGTSSCPLCDYAFAEPGDYDPERATNYRLAREQRLREAEAARETEAAETTSTAPVNLNMPGSSPNAAPGDVMYVAGSLLTLAAGFFFFIFLNTDVSAGGYGIESEVANLDKMAQRALMFDGIVGLALGGIICFGAGGVMNVIVRTGKRLEEAIRDAKSADE